MSLFPPRRPSVRRAHLPRVGAQAVLPGVRVPNVLVSHVDYVFRFGRFRAGFTWVCFPCTRPSLARPWLGPSWRGGGSKIFFRSQQGISTRPRTPRGVPLAAAGFWEVARARFRCKEEFALDFDPRREEKSGSRRDSYSEKSPELPARRHQKERGSGGERSGPEAVLTSSRASVRRRHHATKGAEVQGAEGQGRHALF